MSKSADEFTSMSSDYLYKFIVNRPAVRSNIRILFTEWADEGEHQDGQEWWSNFDTPQEAVLDFGLYLGSREE